MFTHKHVFIQNVSLLVVYLGSLRGKTYRNSCHMFYFIQTSFTFIFMIFLVINKINKPKLVKKMISKVGPFYFNCVKPKIKF